MEFAVIKTGGKQYKVSPGDSVKIEKLSDENKKGDKVVFDKVLLVEGKEGVSIGTPYIAGAKVEGTILDIGREKKVTVIKYKQKSKYFKKYGHKQPYFTVRIDKIR